MKLRNRREAPPSGGFYFLASDGRKITAGDLRDLVRNVSDYYAANGIECPNDLPQIIEDQICGRISNSLCWQGAGDIVAKVVQGGAGAIDSILGTQLQDAAKGCASCGSRRRTLNRLTP